VENQAVGIIERAGKDAQSFALSAWHKEMEQNRTPAVFFHQQELAGQSADQFGDNSQSHRRDNH
jgi:hypothetical protein